MSTFDWILSHDGETLSLQCDGTTMASITRWSDKTTKEHAWFAVERPDSMPLGIHEHFVDACAAAAQGESVAPPPDLLEEWGDATNGDARPSAAPSTRLTNIEFARRAMSIAARASSWARDALDLDLEKPSYGDTAERFIKDIRESLDHMEERLAP